MYGITWFKVLKKCCCALMKYFPNRKFGQGVCVVPSFSINPIPFYIRLHYLLNSHFYEH